MNPLKRFAQYVAALFKLGKTARLSKAANQRSEEASQRVEDLRGDLMALKQDLADVHRDMRQDHHDLKKDTKSWLDHDVDTRMRAMLQEEVRELRARHRELARSYTDLTQRLDRFLIALAKGEAAPEGAAPPASAATLSPDAGLSAFRESFRARLESRLMPKAEAEIPVLRSYLAEAEAGVLRSDEKPVLDLGGPSSAAWTDLLVQNDLPLIVFAPDEEPHGPTARLAAQDDDSLGAVTALSIAPSLPFDELVALVRDALRALAPGGLLLLDVPNPETLSAGASEIYNQPETTRPLTALVLETLLETAGFDPVEIRRIDPDPRRNTLDSGTNAQLADWLYGPRRLVLTASKPLHPDAV